MSLRDFIDSSFSPPINTRQDIKGHLLVLSAKNSGFDKTVK